MPRWLSENSGLQASVNFWPHDSFFYNRFYKNRQIISIKFLENWFFQKGTHGLQFAFMKLKQRMFNGRSYWFITRGGAIVIEQRRNTPQQYYVLAQR